MPDTMIERVARAACDGAGYDWIDAEHHDDLPVVADWMRAARAVLTSMREPTEKMLDAALRGEDEGSGLGVIYTAMIDAALSEEG